MIQMNIYLLKRERSPEMVRVIILRVRYVKTTLSHLLTTHIRSTFILSYLVLRFCWFFVPAYNLSSFIVVV